MKSETDQQLPKINFSGLVIGTSEWNAVRAEVITALNIYGTFEAVYDPLLDPKLREQVFKKAITDLFDLPADVKSLSATYHSKLYVPNVEAFFIYEENKQSIPSFTALMWPQGNTHFCETMERYVEALKELDQMIKKMIMEALGVEDKHYDEMIQKTEYSLSASHYKTEEDHKDDHQYMGSHTDPTVITIVGQDELDGLEVLIKSTGQWIRPAPYCFIVLVGDSMEALTNGRMQATSHRVVKNKNNSRRYETLFMSIAAKGFIIQAPSELIDETQPASTI
ncbi:probable 2-oxoglutarate-dependent dioxygenase AOP1 [Dioscorea cayenensis subsp. rotundata]|uniref:Probable 2-oxoglutarate-dependent dioxygenase AOP1 n=1 Tax=Dioscorea cayennensis subsp. rotundata TaxID=55577 RepID=A0AB40BAN8_DIOCR|nr:probable 2-oxoglutarate-dependent dioxygenase AOP1 [Dioscorea cayenensis subsp. rotundata]